MLETGCWTGWKPAVPEKSSFDADSDPIGFVMRNAR
jgi:hypothetical protein